MAVTLAALEGGVIFAAVCAILLLYAPPGPRPGAARPLSQALAVTAACTIAFNTATPTTAVKNVLVKRVSLACAE
jgi:hypothetical protein